MTTTYDAIIIGTGQAGPFLAGRLAGVGMKVAICERGLFGGTCVNTGCIPTKTLVASAYAAHVARRGAERGIGARTARFECSRVNVSRLMIAYTDFATITYTTRKSRGRTTCSRSRD